MRADIPPIALARRMFEFASTVCSPLKKWLVLSSFQIAANRRLDQSSEFRSRCRVLDAVSGQSAELARSHARSKIRQANVP